MHLEIHKEPWLPQMIRRLGFCVNEEKLPRSLASYANVHYLLIVWDHWYWINPNDGIAIVNLGAFLAALKKNTCLQNLVTELLYEWLPVEGRDFRVVYAISSVNGSAFESPIF